MNVLITLLSPMNSLTQTKTLQTCNGYSEARGSKLLIINCLFIYSKLQFFKIISRRAADVDGECSLPYLTVNAGWHAASSDMLKFSNA